MSINQLKIPVVVLSLIISLGLLLGGQYFYEHYYLWNEFNGKIAQVLPGAKVSIDRNEDPPVVYIKSSGITDLQTSYRQIDKVVKSRLGTQYRLVLQDQRTPQLQKAYESSQFAIQEALVTGGFEKMRQQVNQVAEHFQIEARITIDPSNIYLQMKDRHGYLYEVIPRIQPAGSFDLSQQGGAVGD